MFGYVHANRTALSKEDSKVYQQYYCGLCQQLNQVAGCKGQLLLNYDLCFLAILLSGLYEPKTTTEEFRCFIHPVKTKQNYVNDAIAYAADMDVILSYHSLLDNYNDDKSVISGLYAKALLKKYNQLKVKYQRQALAVEEYISKLSAAEKRGEDNIDLVSNYTGEMLAELFNWKEDEWSCDLSSMGFYLGKFIYLIDAYEDLKKDDKKGNYNPLSKMKKESPKEYETFVRVNLTSLMAECAKSFERLPIIENAEILRNIIYSGVWTKYEYLQLKEKKNTGDKQ